MVSSTSSSPFQPDDYFPFDIAMQLVSEDRFYVHSVRGGDMELKASGRVRAF